MAAVNAIVADPSVVAEAEEPTDPPLAPKPNVKVTGDADANIVALDKVKVVPLIEVT